MQDRIVRSLSEDFAKIGWDKGVNELNRLSTTRLDESLYNVQPITADPIDGPVVTVELLSRIADLDFDTLSEEDCDDLLDGLREKDLPESDYRLAEAAEAVVKALLEKKMRVQNTAGGTSTKAVDGFNTVDGKQVRVSPGEALQRSRRRARLNKKNVSGLRKSAKKAKRTQEKRKRKGLGQFRKGPGPKNKRRVNSDDMGDGLVLELKNILGEGNQYGTYGDTVSRVARIMNLLEAILGDEVGDVLENAYETMEGSLLAENSDPQRAFGPALKVIARCLEQIDDLGND